ncbi:MAG: aldo/keto reductase [Candidatus Lokiarchaeota archaeon]|nr:aldo/keto reductase [Candidatus Lokiarchaeota archaeon]
MNYRKLGSIDWKVSALGFGAMRLPTKKILPRVDWEESIKLIRYAIDNGINYLDTGWIYGLGASEKVIGEALKDGYREKVFLVTKLPMFLVRKTEDFYKYLNQQLKSLQTDYLDAYFFHALSRNQFNKVKELKLMEKMEEAKEKGIIKHVGFSFHDTLPVFREIIDYYDWDLAQIQYNYMDTAIQATHEGLKYAHEKGIAVVVMEPVKGGKLADPPMEALEIMKKASTQRTPVDWALQYVWNQPEVGVVLSGMGSKKMVDENIESASNSGINSLSEDDNIIISELAETYRKNILVQCTACKYCMPCPSGVNIPENFAVLNNVAYTGKKGGMSFLINRRYKKLVNSRKKLNKEYPNGNASLCTKCGECLEKCPQQINIPEELEKVDAILGKGKKISEFYHQN